MELDQISRRRGMVVAMLCSSSFSFGRRETTFLMTVLRLYASMTLSLE